MFFEYSIGIISDRIFKSLHQLFDSDFSEFLFVGISLFDET
ncbi:hypothetical protein LEP1GSC058_1630 [Leptospira fainei serovar Hurstbridge str. BUT 6]|uniref:Uncharacterized protein n=1 Tax=Leptospira fainei serovar Hurstbridge str. BUT 6 TaxID=1193011 RepID=S3VEV6_9LEPT|nr:hypothetical protein LEP1GSC058_1630 [Leptospira fainei serovar Hurstbridge str. BUT 6]